MILIFISCSTFGQRKVYLNDNLIEISKKEFDLIVKHHGNYNLEFDLDTIVAKVAVKRIKKGKISLEKLDFITEELSKNSIIKIPKNGLIIINYYPGKDNCNSTGNIEFVRKKYLNYSDRISRLENINQFFVFKSKEGTERYGEKIEWIPDSKSLIENTFFPIHYPCGSYVILDDEGNYYLHKGEYDIERILKLINRRKSLFEEERN